MNEEKIKEMNNDYNEAQKALKQMELELRSLPTQAKNELNIKFRGYKNDLDNYYRQINKAEQEMNENKIGGSLFDRESVKISHII